MRAICCLQFLLFVASLCFLPPRLHAAAADPLPQLTRLLANSGDAQLQRDILRGISAALKGHRTEPMPLGWEQVETKLTASADPEIKALTQSISLKFGSQKALSDLRGLVMDISATTAVRQTALDSLLAIRDPNLPPLMQQLLKESGLRGSALRGLANYDDAQTPTSILNVYTSLAGAEKRDALNTLASRPAFAKALLTAMDQGAISARDLSADLIRQLRNLKDTEVERLLTKVYGAVRESSADKQMEIARYRNIYRAGGSTPGDGIRGRIVFVKTCQQCHALFGAGGLVGPDITGSNRADLEYILQNIVDPNAVIPNEYRTSNVETKDGRNLTGVVKKQDGNALTIATANETLTLPRSEIASIQQSELSMMPEGLLVQLSDQEVRDLIYYLGRPGQVPLLATPETVTSFFNGKDLTGWEGGANLWKVENGEIVGQTKEGLKRNEFLASQMVFGDFRLTCKVRLTPNTENSGIQFRSELLPNGEVRGYQADIGAGWWGKLYEEQGRGTLWDKSGEAYVKLNDWNAYEIRAIGSKIRTSINGHPCVDLDDPKGTAAGVIALQLHAGGPMEVRFKDFHVQLNP
ncbi:MAG: DUF1080 domain-containing protein [Verrucomicrobiales bacterium]|nr:DUF1080 domain-containing protein [Verrucomicrobiales bacterium]